MLPPQSRGLQGFWTDQIIKWNIRWDIVKGRPQKSAGLKVTRCQTYAGTTRSTRYWWLERGAVCVNYSLGEAFQTGSTRSLGG